MAVKGSSFVLVCLDIYAVACVIILLFRGVDDEPELKAERSSDLRYLFLVAVSEVIDPTIYSDPRPFSSICLNSRIVARSPLYPALESGFGDAFA